MDDFTEQVRYERDLKAAKEEAEQASELESTFLANMSHDVQTPLSSIMNHADLLRREVGKEHEERVRPRHYETPNGRDRGRIDVESESGIRTTFTTRLTG